MSKSSTCPVDFFRSFVFLFPFFLLYVGPMISSCSDADLGPAPIAGR